MKRKQSRIDSACRATIAAACGVALFTSPARADEVCPTPTLAQCQDPAYYQTTCGVPQKAAGSTCETLVRAAYESAIAAEAGTAVQRRLPGTTTDTAPTKLKKQPNTSYGYNVGGLSMNSTGINQKTQLGAFLAPATPGARPAPNSPISVALGVKTLKQQWNENGNRVTSCDEYTYERFYDYSRFEDAAAAQGTNYRAIFNIAYTDPAVKIAYKSPLRDKAGSISADMIWPSKTVPEFGTPNLLPKNEFFAGYEKLIGSGFDLQNATLDTALRGGFDAIDNQGWAWHENMSTALAGTPDEVLNYLDGKKQLFRELVARRQELYTRVQAEVRPTCGPGTWFCLKEHELDLIYADMALRDLLEEADELGCIDTSGPSTCDWSPKMFADMLQTHFNGKKEAAFQKCMKYTTNDFHLASTEAKSVGCGSDDMTTSATQLEVFFTYLQWYINGIGYQIDPESGLPKLSGEYSTSDSLGDLDYFQAKWEFDASWKLENFEGAKQQCNSRIATTVGMVVDAVVLGTEREVFNARANAFTSDTAGGSIDVSVKAMGVDIFTYNKTELAKTFNLVKDARTEKTWQTSMPFVVFGIPLSLKAGISASVGVDATLAMYGGKGCATATPAAGIVIPIGELSGTVNPRAQADVFAAVAVDLLVAEIGVKADLNLIKVQMPFKGNLKIAMSTTRDVFASIDTELKLSLRSLDGSVSVYEDLPWPLPDGEQELFSWDGFVLSDAVLFSYSKSNIPMKLVKQKVDAAIPTFPVTI